MEASLTAVFSISSKADFLVWGSFKLDNFGKNAAD